MSALHPGLDVHVDSAELLLMTLNGPFRFLPLLGQRGILGPLSRTLDKVVSDLLDRANLDFPVLVSHYLEIGRRAASRRTRCVPFPWRWDGGTIFPNLDVIWGMSIKRDCLGVGFALSGPAAAIMVELV